jgi:hypothetical protein
VRATALEVTETTALVELRPCWLARLFGARTIRVPLSVDHDGAYRDSAKAWELRWHPFSCSWTLSSPVILLPAARTVQR